MGEMAEECRTAAENGLGLLDDLDSAIGGSRRRRGQCGLSLHCGVGSAHCDQPELAARRSNTGRRQNESPESKINSVRN